MISSLVPMIIVGGLLEFFLEQEIRESKLNEFEELAELKKQQIENGIHLTSEIVDSISSRTAMRQNLALYNLEPNDFPIDRLNIIIGDLMLVNHDILEVSVVNPDGIVVVSSQKSIVDKDLAQEQYFKTAIMGERFLDYVQHSNYSSMFFSEPLVYEDKIIGVICIYFLDDGGITGQFNLGETGEYILAKRNENGDALFLNTMRFDEDSAFTRIVKQDQLDVPITQALLKHSGVYNDKVDYRGVPVLSVTRYIESADLGLVVKQDKSEAFSLITDLQNLSFMGFALIGIIIFITLFFTSDKITRPLLILKNKLERVSDTNRDISMPLSGTNEIRQLADSFNVMIEKQKESRVKLVESSKRFKTLYENSPLPNYTINKDGLVIGINPAFTKVLGYSEEDIVGKSIFFIVPEKLLSEAKQRFAELQEKDSVNNVEFEFKTKGGRIIPVIASAYTLLEGDSKTYNIIISDITEISNAKKLIQSQLEKLKELDTQKDEFINTLSHELRTPLVPIQANCEMLLDEDFPEKLGKEQKELVDSMTFNLDRLSSLINKLLLLKSLELGKHGYDMQNIPVKEIGNEINANYLGIMSQKNIEFTNLIKNTFTVNADKNAIHQVFDNLINNTFDFLPKENAKVEINVTPQDDKLVFSVKDNGVGISSIHHEKIFDKLYQVDESHTRAHGGLGLGLAICKQLVNDMGGDMWLKSNEDGGSTFYFSLKKGESG